MGSYSFLNHQPHHWGGGGYLDICLDIQKYNKPQRTSAADCVAVYSGPSAIFVNKFQTHLQTKAELCWKTVFFVCFFLAQYLVRNWMIATTSLYAYSCNASNLVSIVM